MRRHRGPRRKLCSEGKISQTDEATSLLPIDESTPQWLRDFFNGVLTVLRADHLAGRPVKGRWVAFSRGRIWFAEHCSGSGYPLVDLVMQIAVNLELELHSARKPRQCIICP